MRSPSRPLAVLLWCALAAAAAGCTTYGSGKAAKPAWKTLVTEHPLLDAPRTLRSGDLEVQVQAVVLEDRHTLFGPSSWVAVLRGTVVNRGRAPLLQQDLQQRFRFQHRSSVEQRGNLFTQGRTGWRSEQGPPQRTELPPGAEGAILVQADSGSNGVRDDPVAVYFDGQRLDLR